MMPTTRFQSLNLATHEHIFKEAVTNEWILDTMNMVYALHKLDGNQAQIFYSAQLSWGFIQVKNS